MPDTTIKPAAIAAPEKLTTETATHASLVAALTHLDLQYWRSCRPGSRSPKSRSRRGCT